MSSSRSNVIPMRLPASTGDSQTIGVQRKAAQTARIPREVKESVNARLRIHGDGVQRVAKSVGLTIRETVNLLIEAYEEEKRVAYRRGYLVGLTEHRTPPPAAAKRAA
jgi:hypothetical protein